jgi:AcrR family transcriptional regulator
MGRTVDKERRAELARRALEVLRQRGIGRTTMSELAEALGVKRPTLYFYFRDLTGLLHAAIEDVYRGWLAHVVARVNGISHPVEALGELARATVEYNRGRRDLVILLFQLWAAGDADPEELLARSRAVSDPLRAELVARLKAGIEKKLVAKCDPERIVELTLTVLDGALVHEVTRGTNGAVVIEELWERVLEPLVIKKAATAQRKKTAS